MKAELARRANPNNPKSRFAGHSGPQVNPVQTFQTLRGRGQLRHRGRNGGRGRWRRRNRGYRGSLNRSRGFQSRFNPSNDSGDARMPCYYCGKLGHFIRTCLVKQADENRRVIAKPFRGPFRGRRGAAGGSEHGRGGHRPYNTRFEDGWQQEDWTQRSIEDSRNRNPEYGPPAAHVARIDRYNSPDRLRANTATIQFRSTLAKIGEPKLPRA